MGGAGDHYVPSELAQSMEEASKLMQGVKEWLPAPYHDLVRVFGMRPSWLRFQDACLQNARGQGPILSFHS